MADASIGLPATHHLHASAGTKGLLQMLWQVDAVNGQQVETLTTKPLEAEGQFGLESIRILPWWHLALQDPFGVWRCGNSPAQLALGAAVVTSGLNVMKA